MKIQQSPSQIYSANNNAKANPNFGIKMSKGFQNELDVIWTQAIKTKAFKESGKSQLELIQEMAKKLTAIKNSFNDSFSIVKQYPNKYTNEACYSIKNPHLGGKSIPVSNYADSNNPFEMLQAFLKIDEKSLVDGRKEMINDYLNNSHMFRLKNPLSRKFNEEKLVQKLDTKTADLFKKMRTERSVDTSEAIAEYYTQRDSAGIISERLATI